MPKEGIEPSRGHPHTILSRARLPNSEVGGQAVLGRQDASPTPWLTERHGYDPTLTLYAIIVKRQYNNMIGA